MKKLLIAIIVISSFLISQSLTKGWYNDDFEVPGKTTTDEFEVLGGTPGVGKVLTDDGAGTGIAVWTAAAGFADPMTTRGDIIYRDPTNVTARLGLGANTFVLTSDGTDISWAASAGGGATTALDNLASVAINQPLLLGTSDAHALGSGTKMWSDLFLASGGVINFDNGDVTLTHSANLLTFNGGNLAMGSNSITITGSFGLTGARVLKGWFTDLEVTNDITIGGNALATIYQPLDGALTNISALVYVSPSFIKLTANDTYAVRTLAEALSDLSGVASGVFSFNDQNVTNISQIDVDIIDSDGSTIQIGTGTNKITLTDNTSIVVALGSDSGDDFIVDGTTLVVEGDSDMVGIGNANPSSILDILRNSSSDQMIRLRNDEGVSKMRFVSADTSEAKHQWTSLGGWVSEISAKFNATKDNQYLQFKVTGTADANTEVGLAAATKMTLLGSGNVGIGTESPDEKLEVEWAANVDVEIGRGTTDTDITFIKLRSPDGTAYWLYPANGGGSLTISATKP